MDSEFGQGTRSRGSRCLVLLFSLGFGSYFIYTKKIGRGNTFFPKIKPRLCRSLGQGGQKLALEPAVRGGYPELAICQKIWENRYSVIAAILPKQKILLKSQIVADMVWIWKVYWLCDKSRIIADILLRFFWGSPIIIVVGVHLAGAPPLVSSGRQSNSLPFLPFTHSETRLFRCAASSFLISSGDNFGRSMVRVSLLSLPVKANGTW